MLYHQKIKLIAIIMLVIVLLSSCRNAITNNTTNSKSIVQPIKNNNFNELIQYFADSSKREIPIPIIVMRDFLEGYSDSNSIISVYALDSFSTTQGTFLLIKTICPAGGVCATFHMLFFDINNEFMHDSIVGEESGEEIETYIFNYEYSPKNEELTTYRIHYDSERDIVFDTNTKIIKLTTWRKK